MNDELHIVEIVGVNTVVMGWFCNFDVVTMVYGVNNNLQIFDFSNFAPITIFTL